MNAVQNILPIMFVNKRWLKCKNKSVSFKPTIYTSSMCMKGIIKQEFWISCIVSKRLYPSEILLIQADLILDIIHIGL